MLEKSTALGATALAIALAWPTLAAAQSTAQSGAATTSQYPSRPVTLVVPFPPGGGTDTGARLIAQKLSQKWGQSVVIENRAGAAGIVGVEAVARAKPDGYTLLMGNVGTQTINPPLYGKVPYDPVHALTPISLVADLPIVLVAAPAFKATSVADVVALGKAEPGKYSFASSGTGNSTHLAYEIFQTATGARFLHVPYKGGGPANADVIAGHIDMEFTTIYGATGIIESGKFRPLAVASDVRSPALPSVPTLAEAGVKDSVMGSWIGILAPTGTPRPIIDKIAADVREAVSTADVKTTMISQGATPRSSTPAEFQALIDADSKRFTALVKQLNLHAE